MAIRVAVLNGCTIQSNGGGYITVFADSNALETITVTLLKDGVGFSGTHSGSTVFGGSKYSYSHQFTSITDGNYTIEVTGSVNGTDIIWDSSDSVIIFCSACDITLDVSETQPDINGAGTGQITAVSTSSHEPIEYAFGNTILWGSNPVFSNISAGTYTIYARDAVGCTISKTITVTNGSCTISINSLITTNETSPNAGNGTVTSNVLGAFGTVQYSLDNTNFTNNPTFQNLIPGTYTYYVRDSVGCTTSQSFVIGATNLNFDPIPDDYLEDERFTISYQPELRSWTSLHSYVPNHYVSRGNRVYMSINDKNTFWELGTGPKGVYFDEPVQKFKIKFVMNKNPSNTKKFDTMVLYTSSKQGENEQLFDTFNTITCYTSHQHTGDIELVIGKKVDIPLSEIQYRTRVEAVANEFRISIPRDLVFNGNLSIFDSSNWVRDSVYGSTPEVRKWRNQLTDKYMVVELEYNNEHDFELDLHSVKTLFRIVPR